MQRRVLVVVEEPLRSQLAAALRRSGHIAYLAADETTAIALAREHRCEIALLEIALPVRNAYRLATALRPHLTNAPLVIGIAAEIAPPPTVSIDCGMACVFVKPLEIAELLVLIDRWSPT